MNNKMIITKKFLKEHGACTESYKYVCQHGYIGLEAVPFLERLISEDRLSDANWLIVRVMTRTQRLQYAIYAAEQVIHIYESQYPDDKRPRQAIDTAKAVLANATEENRAAAVDAARAAGVAWAAAGAAARAAARAAVAAARAAVDAAGDAARAAGAAARAAAGDAGDAMQLKILQTGLVIIKDKDKQFSTVIRED